MENQEKPEVIVTRPYGEAEIELHAAKVAGRRNLREVSILTDEGQYQFDYLIKKPSRAVMQAVTDKKDSKDVNGVAKLLMGCVLEGDTEAYDNDGAIYEQLLKSIGGLVQSADGHLKKI